MLDVSGAFKAFIQTYAGMKPDEEKLALMEIRHQVMQLEDENSDLKRQVKSLREKLAERKKMEQVKGTCYILEDDGTKTGPICPQCYVEDGIVMLLESDAHGASCSRCRTRYAGVTSDIDGPIAMAFILIGIYLVKRI